MPELSVLNAKLKLKGDTHAHLVEGDPVLLDRELCIETDTFSVSGGVRVYKAKLGPGQWSMLPYTSIGSGLTEAAVIAQIAAHASAADPHGDRAYTDAEVTAEAAARDAAIAAITGTLGTAAVRNTGVDEGDVPVLGAGGKLPSTTLPALAITDTYPVDDEAGMLACAAEKGDIAIRSDVSKSYILREEPATVIGNWNELKTPTDAVLAVAGLTGSISASDLKLALALGNVSNTADTDKPVSTAQAAADAALQTQITALKTEVISGGIRKAANGSYTLDRAAAYAYTILSLTVASGSGTVTAKVMVDGVDVTGISAVAVSTSETLATASAANAVAIGATVELVLSANAAALGLGFTLKILRT